MQRDMTDFSVNHAASARPLFVSLLRRWALSHWRLIATIMLLVIVLVEGFVAVCKRTGGDVDLHYHLGRAILGGDFLRTGQKWPAGWHYQRSMISNTRYLLGRQLVSAAVASLPPRAARGVYYFAAVVLSAGTWLCWRRLAQAPERTDKSESASVAAALAAAGLLLPWLLRDLDECGLQLILLFFLSAAAVALATGRSAMTGFWLGLAITWKTVPILFVPLLLWKRRFREAIWTLVFAAFFNGLFPLVVLGPSRTTEYYACALAVRLQKPAADDPSLDVEVDPKPQNQSLQMAMVRFLVRYPPGHPYFKEVRFLPAHPLFFQPGNLSPATARRISLVALALLAGLLAWRLRHKWGEGSAQADLPAEWAAVIALAALLSPVCWLQHLVLLWPAAFLILRRTFTVRPHRSPWVAIGFVALCILVLQRGVLHYELSIVALSYHLPTLAALVLLALVLLPPATEIAAPILSEDPPARLGKNP
jgi:hypothetical protein